MNIWAVLVAGVSSFLLGGLWYAKPLFGDAWNKENGSKEMAGHSARIFLTSLAFSIVAALAFGVWLGAAPPLESALKAGVLAGVLVAASFGINYQFAQRSFKLWLIDGGYHFVQFVLFGLILGIWH